MKSFNFRKNPDSRAVTLRMNQVNTQNLGRHFEINPSTLYLKEQYGETLEFSIADGRFDLTSYNENHDFLVLGETGGSSNTSWNTPEIPSRSSTPVQTPTSSRRVSPLAVVKVVRADLGTNGRPINQQLHNLTAVINIQEESEANVCFIESKVRKEMHDNSLLIVGANGLRLFEQEGTTGSAFWRVGSRKIFAVPESEFRKRDEDYPQISKRRKLSNTQETSNDLANAIENLTTEVGEMKAELAKYKELAFKYRFSLSFIKAFEEAFSCAICKRTPANLPLIGCHSCSSLVGCEACVNSWYANDRNLTKGCPKCRATRGLSKTYIMKGFEELVEQINTLVAENEGALDDTVPIINEDQEE